MKYSVLIIIIIVIALSSCTSAAETQIKEESNPTIQMLIAREQTFVQRYKLSEQLFEYIKLQHPEQIALLIEIDYELAFLKVKQKKYALAKTMFEEIINQYELSEKKDELPLWPYYLSKKLLDDVVTPALEKKTSPKKQKKNKQKA